MYRYEVVITYKALQVVAVQYASSLEDAIDRADELNKLFGFTSELYASVDGSIVMQLV